ncbi:hypothetical protein KGY23_004817 [Salmonella enterica]|nr:hypothetical protein [Salmonella enterica]EBC2163570.1 hypothetical protein [Salmonella enterica]EBE4166103.1 hypothetical protein [Salmonella enterica]EBH5164177.1 hypothetical protein [Salmonella enterica]EBL1620349.1 hypothetical protein [Salmonella enterica]
MNRKIAGMVRPLLPVLLLAGLSVSIQAAATVDTGIAPAGNSVVSRSNGAMTMSGDILEGTCRLSTNNTTINFKPMTVAEIEAKGDGGVIGQFDVVLNINNCNGLPLDISINSGDMLSPDKYRAYILYSNQQVGLYYSVDVHANSGYCFSYNGGDSCKSVDSGLPLDGSIPTPVLGEYYYKPDSDSYQMTLHTTLYYDNSKGKLPVAIYTGSYIYTVSYH